MSATIRANEHANTANPPRMKINFKQIEAFIVVAELSSFRKAAEKLNTTQPNISSRLSSLESLLEVKLIERDSASVRLTPSGKMLLPKAREVIQSMDHFVATAGQEQLFEGTLRLGVTEIIVHSWLGKFITAFKQRFANIDVDLTVDVSSNLSKALDNRSIDLALQSGPFISPATGVVELGQYHLVWVCAPSLQYSNGELSLEALVKHPLLTHAKGTLPYEQLQRHLSKELAQKKLISRFVSSSNLASCLQMTCDGLGIACMAEAMVRDEIKTGILTQIQYPWVPEPLQFSARYDTDSAPLYASEAANIAGQIATKFAS